MADAAENKGVATEVRSIIEDYIKPVVGEIIEPGTGAKALAVITGTGVKPVDPEFFEGYRERPRLRVGTAILTHIDSLIDHVNRFKDEDSALFAWDDRKAPSITALLDYHRAGPEADPRLGKHRSRFDFPLSDEWKAWTEADGRQFGMAEFAAFLEDRIIDVIELIGGEDALPEDLARFINICGGNVASPSKLVELSRGLKVNEKSAVKEAINLSTGEAQIQFQAEHVDEYGAPLQVPNLFLIGIPVFKGGPLYRLAARLRYRKTAGPLSFFYELWRADRTFDHAFAEACERVRIETDLPLLFGRAE